MYTGYQFKIAVLMLFSTLCNAQTVYFHQDFSKTTSLINPQPDTGQFSHIILTAPALSYHKFHKGYMELVRTQQDSATGGIIRAMRAEPFSPNPETLFIQIRFSAESVRSTTVNAIYFYVGENFNPVNNSFPGNGLMFGKCSINFLDGSFTIKDLETQLTSKAFGTKTAVTLTWVLNNSDKPFPYRISEKLGETMAMPGTYDLWADDEPINKGSKAYPGNTSYSKTKLSNFEIRFRNGLGQIRIDDILIREGKLPPETDETMVAPNPVSGDVIMLSARDADLASVKLVNVAGQEIRAKVVRITKMQVKITPDSKLKSGIYIVYFKTGTGQSRAVKAIVE
jgi:hypothetical protein